MRGVLYISFTKKLKIYTNVFLIILPLLTSGTLPASHVRVRSKWDFPRPFFTDERYRRHCTRSVIPLTKILQITEKKYILNTSDQCGRSEEQCRFDMWIIFFLLLFGSNSHNADWLNVRYHLFVERRTKSKNFPRDIIHCWYFTIVAIFHRRVSYAERVRLYRLFAHVMYIQFKCNGKYRKFICIIIFHILIISVDRIISLIPLRPINNVIV